jgi:hypothetical protein
VELTGGAAHLDGDPIEKSPFTIRAGQVLSIGSTHIAFGEASDVWDAISIPELKILGGVAPVSAQVELSELSKPDAKAVPEAPKAARYPSGRAIFLASVALVIVILLGIFFYNTDRSRGGQSVMRQEGGGAASFVMDMSKTNEDNNAVEAVANKLRHEVSGISVSTYERSGKAVLRAYVRTREQANSVQRIVNESTTPVFSEIVSLQEVENSAEMMASMKGFAVDVTFAKDGTAYWTGYLPEKSDWKSVLDRLEVDLPFIKDNVCNITFASDIEQRAKELASESGIKASLVFIPRPRELVVSGSLPESLSVSWNGVFAKLKEQFGSIVTLTNDVGTGKTVIVEGNPFHSPISGVTLGAIPSVILLDGQRIYTGSILADGSVLSEISSDQLILTGPSGRRKIPLDLGAGAGGL